MPREISVAELAGWLADAGRAAPLVLDVRNHWEFELVALPGAMLLPLAELEEQLDALEPNRGRPIVCVCHHGVRSLSAAVFLRERGFDATSARGGMDAWSTEIDPSAPRY